MFRRVAAGCVTESPPGGWHRQPAGATTLKKWACTKNGRALGRSAMKSGLFASEPLPPAARRAIVAGFVGFAVDFFDIYLPVLVLAPVMSYFEPKGLSSTATTTIYYFTIVATLLGRPCGAVIFGHWADKIGRRRTTMISIAGFGMFHRADRLHPGLRRDRCLVADPADRDPLRRRRVHGRRVHLEQHAGPRDGAARPPRLRRRPDPGCVPGRLRPDHASSPRSC